MAAESFAVTGVFQLFVYRSATGKVFIKKLKSTQVMLFLCFKVLHQLTLFPASLHSLAKDSETFTASCFHPWPYFCSVACVNHLRSLSAWKMPPW